MPFDKYIWPILHILIGVGNAILNYLIDIIENEIQLIPPKELRMRRELGELEERHRTLKDQRDYFDSPNEDSGSETIKKHRQHQRECENEMDDLEDRGLESTEEYSTLWNTSELCKSEIKSLEGERKSMTTRVDNARKAVSKKKEALLACRRARKTEDTSIYTGVDRILQKH